MRLTIIFKLLTISGLIAKSNIYSLPLKLFHNKNTKKRIIIILNTPLKNNDY